jgi:hypothetical protein
MTVEIDKIDWSILNSLSDDYESLEMIIPMAQEIVPNVEDKVIQEKVGQLLILGYINTMVESDDWYGMTSRGCEVWEKYCAIFSDGPPDWCKSWTINTDYKTGDGYAIGVSKEVCESAIATKIGSDIIVDPSTFKHSAIEAFHAKYYKEIKGGHRIDFCFTKKAA